MATVGHTGTGSPRATTAKLAVIEKTDIKPKLPDQTRWEAASRTFIGDPSLDAASQQKHLVGI